MPSLEAKGLRPDTFSWRQHISQRGRRCEPGLSFCLQKTGAPELHSENSVTEQGPLPPPQPSPGSIPCVDRCFRTENRPGSSPASSPGSVSDLREASLGDFVPRDLHIHLVLS